MADLARLQQARELKQWMDEYEDSKELWANYLPLPSLLTTSEAVKMCAVLVPKRHGTLSRRQPTGMKQWRPHHAVLEDQVLSLYKSKDDMMLKKQPSATVDMCAVIKVKFEKQLEIKTLGRGNATEGYFSVSTADKEYLLFADHSEGEDAAEWVRDLEQNVKFALQVNT
jgi:hypothetical protein